MPTPSKAEQEQDLARSILARNGEGEKAVSPEAVANSVVVPQTQVGTSPPTAGLDQSTLLWLVGSFADEIDPWGRRPKVRDKQLRAFLTTESLFTSALGLVAARNMGFNWMIEGPKAVAAESQRILNEANNGKGWEDFVSKLSMDLYTQDGGAFIEVVRGGNSPEGPLIGVNSLDADRCYHTGDPFKPVIYQDRESKYHQLNWWEVVTLAELPTSIEHLYGIQICALSRLLLAAQITKNIAIYQAEKTAGRHTRAMHIIQGLTTSQIQDALLSMQSKADGQGLTRYVNPLVVGTVDPQAEIDVKTLEFAGVPDGFDAEQAFKHYIAQIAMAFLSDYQDFAPLPGGNLGTSSQSDVLHAKSRGKGPALWMNLIVNAMNMKILPSIVEFSFEEQDIEAEEQVAGTRKMRADERSVRIASKELLPAEARQLAVDTGDLPKELFEAAGGLEFESPVKESPLREGEVPADTTGNLIAEGDSPEDAKEARDRKTVSPFWVRGRESG